jgi:hypothetical protein
VTRDPGAVRPFRLVRVKDTSGVSGTGHVADGVMFPDGVTVLRWLGKYASTVVWASIDDALAVHGHDGATRVEWLDR